MARRSDWCGLYACLCCALPHFACKCAHVLSRCARGLSNFQSWAFILQPKASRLFYDKYLSLSSFIYLWFCTMEATLEVFWCWRRAGRRWLDCICWPLTSVNHPSSDSAPLWNGAAGQVNESDFEAALVWLVCWWRHGFWKQTSSAHDGFLTHLLGCSDISVVFLLWWLSGLHLDNRWTNKLQRFLTSSVDCFGVNQHPHSAAPSLFLSQAPLSQSFLVDCWWLAYLFRDVTVLWPETRESSPAWAEGPRAETLGGGQFAEFHCVSYSWPCAQLWPPTPAEICHERGAA